MKLLKTLLKSHKESLLKAKKYLTNEDFLLKGINISLDFFFLTMNARFHLWVHCINVNQLGCQNCSI